jgi:hypothetical protein
MGDMGDNLPPSVTTGDDGADDPDTPTHTTPSDDINPDVARFLI